MTAAIPDDVMWAARIVAKYVECMPSEGNISFIARALLSERNRATETEREKNAVIAETINTFIPGLPSHHENNIKCAEGDRIAAAIRNPAGE